MTVRILQYDCVDFGNTTVRFPQYDRAVSQYDRAVSQYDRAVLQYDRAVSQYERQRSGTFRMASVHTISEALDARARRVYGYGSAYAVTGSSVP